MENLKLLNKYRKKLSVYFAIFVLLSVWMIVLFYDVTKYLNNINIEEKSLQSKTNQIENLIRNAKSYSKLKEITFKRLIKKIVSDSEIRSGGLVITSELGGFNEYNLLIDNTFVNIEGSKYLKTIFESKGNTYSIIVRKELRFNKDEYINGYFYFILFSLPYIIILYFIGYFFVGRNLKSIKETIINLEDFTGNIRHEFKTPLSEIISSLELSNKTGEYKESNKQSIRSAKRLNRILDSLLGIITITDSSYKRQIVDIVNYSKVIIDENNKAIVSKKLNININSEKSHIYKKINKEHFYIVFSNLISNAIKYSKEGGIININLNKNKFFIEDFGIGISKKNLKNIFGKYFRENYSENKGMGIGLSISKKIADINKWGLKIKSRKGHGTKSSIYFS